MLSEKSSHRWMNTARLCVHEAPAMVAFTESGWRGGGRPAEGGVGSC